MEHVENRLCVAVALVMSVCGAFLQYWNQNTSFDAQTTLPLPEAPALFAMWVFVLCVPLAALLLSLLCKTRAVEEEQVNAHLPWIAAQRVLGVLAAFAFVDGAVLAMVLNDSPAILDYLAAGGQAAAGVAMILLMQPKWRNRPTLAALLPGFAACLLLLQFYQNNAQDPAVSRYCWYLLFLMAAAPAFYLQAACAYGRLRVRAARAFSLIACVYAAQAMPDFDSVAELFTLAGVWLWMLLQCSAAVDRAIPLESLEAPLQ